jgi:hypothetical protein
MRGGSMGVGNNPTGGSTSMRPSTAPGGDWKAAAVDAGDVFAAPRFRNGMFGGTG